VLDSDKIYRFIDLSGFVDILSSGRMYLRQVMTWDDPYETNALQYLVNELLEKTDLAIIKPSSAKSAMVEDLRFRIRQKIRERAVKSIYAQSWTALSESDALWRIYSPDKKGIRIGVLWRDVANAIQREYVHMKHYPVEYLTAEESRQAILKRFENSGKKIDLSACCRYKRKEFEHEQEYRFCMAHQPEGHRDVDLGGLDFNDEKELQRSLNQLVDLQYDRLKYYPFEAARIRGVMLDPRLDREKDNWYIGIIQNLCKAHEVEATVQISDLYR
jgi:hypothetical protein